MTQQPTILVVDDEDPVRYVLCVLLETEGFSVIEASDGRECLRLAYDHHPDLVLLDILMPDRDGREICQQLRDISPDLPIIMLTALSEEAEKVARLYDGADDYVTKPFHQDELLARIRSVLRRSQRSRIPSVQAYKDSLLSIDFQTHQVSLHGKPVPLSPKEWRLLEYLVEHKDHVATHNELLHYVWGGGFEKERRYVKVFISRLRQKLGDNCKSPRYIHTSREQGYIFRSHS